MRRVPIRIPGLGVCADADWTNLDCAAGVARKHGGRLTKVMIGLSAAARMP